MEQNQRYTRQILLPEVGEKGQELLAQARVLVIGAGGLGCPILTYLAAAGIGHLAIADMDTVSESNLHRQPLFTHEDLGQNKALVAKAKLAKLNPLIKITAYPEGLSANNALALIGPYNLIVDGTDNFESRYLINDSCVQLNKPWVFGAIYKFQGQWGVFNLNGSATYRCMFPTAPPPLSAPSCNQIGVLGIVPGIIGSFQANEVLKLILFPDQVNAGVMQYLNTADNTIHKIAVAPNKQAIAKVNSMNIEQYDYASFCGLQSHIPELNLTQVFALYEPIFVDVRNADELPKVSALNPIALPLPSLPTQAQALDKECTYVLFCQSGIRSKQAAQRLIDLGFKNVYSLKQGAIALKQQVSKKIQNEQTH